MPTRLQSSDHRWPPLSFAQWRETYETLHLYTQIVGKIRTSLVPPLNHWWHSTLLATPRGLTTTLIPFGERFFELRFDFRDHELHLETSDGMSVAIPLQGHSVAEFYGKIREALDMADIPLRISTLPQEMASALRFEQDSVHGEYVPEHAARFWQVFMQSHQVMSRFRSRFIGKCSPVHFFWGSFDLAVTRFSGRRAPVHPGGIPNLADWVAREAYSHEVSSCGFWPGNEGNEACYYSYAYPEPPGFREARVRPRDAFFNVQMKEFMLPYERVRNAADPGALLMEFFESTYEAGAVSWDRDSLERIRSRQTSAGASSEPSGSP